MIRTMPAAPTDRVRVRRLPARGAYDRTTIDAILDEALVCHLGLVEDGQPFVVPTIHARSGDLVYLHGSSASRAMRRAGEGVDVCVTATLLDGLVLARSAFHHSMNYRAVVLLGRPRAVVDPEEKLAALRAISEHVLPGRWDEVRAPNDVELKATSVVALAIDEASAKVRTGGPLDDAEDLALDCWAGVLPLRLVAGAPLPAGDLAPGIAPSPAVGRDRRHAPGQTGQAHER
ncbi:MAG: pyridoxamine 5'-phosphate oxidase family protein [Alphaproteobacteria bacterium]